MVLTTNNKIGEVIALKSYAYLNDKIEKKANAKNNENKSFKFDNDRHNGIWYSTVTIAIEDENTSTPTYYTENLDFIEIREILEEKHHVHSFIKKIKHYLNLHNIHEC